MVMLIFHKVLIHALASQEYEVQVREALIKGNLTFLEALQLEEFRVRNRISPQNRDNLLIGVRQSVPNLQLNNVLEYFNPDRFAQPRDEKTEISLRKSAQYKSNRCHSCNDSLGMLRQRQCSYCYYRYCSNCISSTPAKVISIQPTNLILLNAI
jgi:hypothetical protein